MSCGVGLGCSFDPTLLWLWCRPVAAALIQPLAWELPHATSVALKKQKKPKKTKNLHNLSSAPLPNALPTPRTLSPLSHTVPLGLGPSLYLEWLPPISHSIKVLLSHESLVQNPF